MIRLQGNRPGPHSLSCMEERSCPFPPLSPLPAFIDFIPRHYHYVGMLRGALCSAARLLPSFVQLYIFLSLIWLLIVAFLQKVAPSFSLKRSGFHRIYDL